MWKKKKHFSCDQVNNMWYNNKSLEVSVLTVGIYDLYKLWILRCSVWPLRDFEATGRPYLHSPKKQFAIGINGILQVLQLKCFKDKITCEYFCCCSVDSNIRTFKKMIL